jgi:hypothetical protein
MFSEGGFRFQSSDNQGSEESRDVSNLRIIESTVVTIRESRMLYHAAQWMRGED